MATDTHSDPTSARLTIGQLATFVGVTVRAIRHYHQRGLLAEPTRDPSGYRRYDAQAVLDLIHIKILSDAGAPLARIDELLDAGPEQLAAAVAEIDAAFQRQIHELEHRRRRLADLVDGERGFLPPELVGYLDDLRAAGISPHMVLIEREEWILLLARYPEHALEWLAHKRADLADPAYRRLFRGYDEAAAWDPADPRLEKLADAMADALVGYLVPRHPGEDDAPDLTTADPTVLALLTAHFGRNSPPAQRRLANLVAEKLEGR